MADNLYQFTGKVKLDQVFPRLFSRDFIFCFCQKNLPSFGLAKKKVFGLTLLSRKSLEKGRFLLIIIFARQGCVSVSFAVLQYTVVNHKYHVPFARHQAVFDIPLFIHSFRILAQCSART